MLRNLHPVGLNQPVPVGGARRRPGLPRHVDELPPLPHLGRRLPGAATSCHLSCGLLFGGAAVAFVPLFS